MSLKNIWTAAGDGDLDRVKRLLDEGQSPNDKDQNSYTALHAAASWSSPDILRLLVERGGNINITDEDGETPLFVVESVDMAKLVLELGGDPKHKNAEGLTAAQNLAEDQRAVAAYLAGITGESIDLADEADASMDATADTASGQMISRAQQIIQQANEAGEEPDEALRALVQETLAQAAETGASLQPNQDLVNGNHSDASRKRQR